MTETKTIHLTISPDLTDYPNPSSHGRLSCIVTELHVLEREDSYFVGSVIYLPNSMRHPSPALDLLSWPHSYTSAYSTLLGLGRRGLGEHHGYDRLQGYALFLSGVILHTELNVVSRPLR